MVIECGTTFIIGVALSVLGIGGKVVLSKVRLDWLPVDIGKVSIGFGALIMLIGLFGSNIGVCQ